MREIIQNSSKRLTFAAAFSILYIMKVFGLRSSVFGLRSSVFGLRSSVFGLRSSVFGLRSRII